MANDDSTRIQRRQLLPPAVADSVIDGVVRTINELARESALAFTLAAGQAILRDVYGGDHAAWRARGEHDASFRKLAARCRDRDTGLGDLHVSASTLYRCVTIAEMWARLELSAPGRLGVTQLRAVVGLPEVHQRRLLAAAASGELDGAALEAEAARLRARAGPRRGRRPLPAVVRRVRELERAASPADVEAELGELESLDEAAAAALVASLDRVQRACDELRGRLVGRGEGAAPRD